MEVTLNLNRAQIKRISTRWGGYNVTSSIAATSQVTSFNARTGVVTLASSDVTTALGFTPQVAGSYLTANQTITLSGDVTGSGATAITTALANSGVTAGSYTNASITVDAKGRVTVASSGAGGGSGTVTSVSVTTANGVSGSVATATTTPAITITLGAITPTSVICGTLTCNGTGGVGYSTGAGGTVTQTTSRTTGVTLSKLAGAITLFSTTTTAGLVNSFTVTNTLVAASDTINLSVKTATGIYLCFVTTVAAGSFKISVYTPAAVGTAEAPVINFAVIKGATA